MKVNELLEEMDLAAVVGEELVTKYGTLRRDTETARQLGIKVQELWNRRSRGKPVPRYVRLGRRLVMTPQKCIDEFIATRLIGS